MKDPGMPARKLSPVAVVSIFIGVVVLWALTPVVISHVYPDLAHRGQAGDLFGSINALFSGLAFAGVIVAILLQREELELQRHEIAANRVELARAATAQEESREALRKTIYAQAYKTAMDILQADAVRQARGVVLSELRDELFDNWTYSQRHAAETVCHTYDSVGTMVRHDMLPVEYIADSWGDSLRRTRKIVKPLVEKYRLERDAKEYWDDYEYLAQEALRFQKGNPHVIAPTTAT
jgi:hypothetical protein